MRGVGNPFFTTPPHQCEEWAFHQLDDFEQQQDEDDGEDEGNSTAAVVAEPWPHAVTTKAEHKNQNDQKNKHFVFLRAAKFRPMEV